jgi:hypothetical protein
MGKINTNKYTYIKTDLYCPESEKDQLKSEHEDIGVLLMVTLSDFQIKSELVRVESGLLRNFKDQAKKIQGKSEKIV